KYGGFEAKVSCTGSALTPSLSRVGVNNYAAETIEAPMSCQAEACYIAFVWIQRPPRTNILHYQRGTSFTLFVRLQVQCSIGVSIKPLWLIYRVPDMTTEPDWRNPLDTSSMFGVDMIILNVPSFTLDYGLYLFYFTVEVNPVRTTTILRGADRVYVQIEGASLVASIAGGTFRTVGFSDTWTLDGSASYDPNSQEGLKNITFTWYCTKKASDYNSMVVSPGKKCHPSQPDLRWLTSSGPVQTIAPETLPGNATYYFRLVIQKNQQSSHVDQTVEVQTGSPLRVDVVCIENCGKYLIPTERFILSAKCANCRTHGQPVFYWSLFGENSAEISFDWASRTRTGRFSSYLSIHALTFTKSVHQSYVLQLKATTPNGRSSVYKYLFMLNSPPRAGRCTINPRSGIAFQTKFVVQCSDFSDSDLPLTYKVILASGLSRTTQITSVEENTFGTILYFGYQPKTPPSILPVGVPSQNYIQTLYVQVHDSHGAFTQVNVSARVENPVSRQSAGDAFNELVSGLSAPMTSYLQMGDYFSAGYLAYLSASVLNYLKATPGLQLQNAGFRETLIKITSNISVENTMEINQVVASLCQATEEADEVNVLSQDLALEKLTEVTRALKALRNERHWSEEAEIQASGILGCLSNILKAALLRPSNVNINGVKQVFSIMENLTDVVFQGKVPGETETLMGTKQWNITLNKDETWNITDAFSTRNDCRNCFYPSVKRQNDSGQPQDTVISTALFEFHDNPFPWLGYASEIKTNVLGFKMAETKANGELQGIVPEEAEVIIARKDTESSSFLLAMGPDKTESYTTGGFNFEVSRNAKRVYIQIRTELKATFKVLVFKGTNITDAHPIASFVASHNLPTVPSSGETAGSDCNDKSPYVICLPESLLAAISQENSTSHYNISIVLQTPYVTRYQKRGLVSVQIFSDECLFLDGIRSSWRADTCKLGSLTDWQRVHCICNMEQSDPKLLGDTASRVSMLGIRFLAAKVIVAPNKIDLGKNLIADIRKNPVTLLTVIFIFLIYFLLSLWAVRKDRADRDSEKQIIVLPDNDPSDKGSFLVTLYTGSRCGAGTTADVFIQLIGQKDMSDVRCLRHPRFTCFRQGSVDCFLLTTKEDLGDICAFRVWHNNTGPFPSWFLSRAEVENVSIRRRWFFMCRKWLSLDKDDCLLERTFYVTNPKTPLARTDYFLINFTNNLTEGHLWLSIFAHILTNSFSRLQRLSSCLAILLLNLLVNIMFFNADKNEATSKHLRYARSVTVGIECALLTVPLEMLIIALFKYSQKEPSPPRVAQTDPTASKHLPSKSLKNMKQRLQKWRLPKASAPSRDISLKNLTSERDANVIASEEQRTTMASSPAFQRRPPSNPDGSTNYIEGRNFKKQKKPRRFNIMTCPWCIYVSWALVIAVSGISAFFIVLYGLSYGYQTSVEWLVASGVSFLENVFCISVLKISFFAAVNTIRPKHYRDIIWVTQKKDSEIKLAKERMSADAKRETHLKLAKLRGTKQYKAPDAAEIAVMMKRAKIRAAAFAFLKGFISHLVFLTLLLNFIYSSENANSFHYNQFMLNQFSPRLSSVDKLEHIYL
ncbi:PKDRE protein, partial [Rhinopomastus cyanomelas]|nr:PKDRE protein [Rhinopomastus cyanomelas]